MYQARESKIQSNLTLLEITYGIIEIPDSINIVNNTSLKIFMFHRRLPTFMDYRYNWSAFLDCTGVILDLSNDRKDHF